MCVCRKVFMKLFVFSIEFPVINYNYVCVCMCMCVCVGWWWVFCLTEVIQKVSFTSKKTFLSKMNGSDGHWSIEACGGHLGVGQVLYVQNDAFGRISLSPCSVTLWLEQILFLCLLMKCAQVSFSLTRQPFDSSWALYIY